MDIVLEAVDSFSLDALGLAYARLRFSSAV